MSRSPKLLLIAYACRPNCGSEPGTGWNRALQTSRYYDTWVVCEGREFERPIREYLAQHGPLPRLTFVYLPRSAWLERMHKIPGLYYWAYRLWHRAAWRLSQKLHAEIKFDLVHLATLSGFREPGYVWKLPIPLVWGPVGGAQNYPWRFLSAAGLRGALKEAVRSVLNTLQLKYSPRVGKVGRHAAAVLAVSTTNAQALAARLGYVPQVLSDIGALPQSAPARSFEHQGPLRILWGGLFEDRKALHLLLRAIAQLPPDVPYELHVLSDGPLRKRWQQLAQQLGVAAHCRWLGWVDRKLVPDEYRWADVFVFSSLRDSSGTVLLEALAQGTPVLTLDHQGAADIVTSQCGIKVPVRTPRQVVADFAAALAQLHHDRTQLSKLSEGAFERAGQYSWELSGERMAAVYRQVLASAGAIQPATSSDEELPVPGTVRELADELLAGAAAERG